MRTEIHKSTCLPLYNHHHWLNHCLLGAAQDVLVRTPRLGSSGLFDCPRRNNLFFDSKLRLYIQRVRGLGVVQYTRCVDACDQLQHEDDDCLYQGSALNYPNMLGWATAIDCSVVVA